MFNHPSDVYSYKRNLFVAVIERTFDMYVYILYTSLSLLHVYITIPVIYAYAFF